MDQPLTQPAAPGPNWWKRNWKWFVPLGCFTVALLFLAFVGSIVVIVFSAMKSTDVYKEALARAKADPAVIEAASSESNLAIPISGPKGKGTIYVGKQVTRAMELFRARRGSRTNASAHRSSSKVSAVQVSLIFFDGSWSECKKKTSSRKPNSNRLVFPAERVDYQDRKASGTRCPLARRSLGEGGSTRWKLRLGRLEFVR